MNESIHFDDKDSVDEDGSSTWDNISTAHGRLRRKQRGIDKKDLQAAMKYGEQSNEGQRIMYTYKDIVYIVNAVTKEEVTCYALPLPLETVKIDDDMMEEHETFQTKIRSNLDCWTSNNVVVVDTSGSMRTSDVWGARDRLGAVWISIALDFVAHRIESGEGKPTDVISVITLCENPIIVIEEQPCTWVTYNNIVTIYMEQKCHALGHGPFLPALSLAEKLLCRNWDSACVPSLIFLSDGAPSDIWLREPDIMEKVSKKRTKPKNKKIYNQNMEYQNQLIIEQMKELAQRFGRRLTFSAIGIGDKKQFKTLEDMVQTAKEYGVRAELQLPSLSSEAISIAFTSTVTSTLNTQRELTNLVTLTQSKVRNVIRESKSIASKQMLEVNENDFWIYKKHFVTRKVVDRRGVCFDESPVRHPKAMFVAVGKHPFGEGVEKLVYRFFEVAEDMKTIVGIPMVAKGSRFVIGENCDDENDIRNMEENVAKLFCRTQNRAREYAHKFNKKMKSLPRIHPDTPQIQFVDCFIYELNDEVLGNRSFLVEEKFNNNKWGKWNDNAGSVYDHGNKQNNATNTNFRLIANGFQNYQQCLDIEDEESDEGSDDLDKDDQWMTPLQPDIFSPSIVAQAFSHFTYILSGRKRLVCDLQGIFDQENKILKLTDPVIHYYNESHSIKKQGYGKTDLGRKGFETFFATHCGETCGILCKLMIRGYKSKKIERK